MNWSNVWPWRWALGRKAPARRKPSSAQLAVEALEDRLVPSTSASDAAYQAWRAQTYTINDATVSAAIKPAASLVQTVSAPQNASFGSMIGLPSVFNNTSYRGTGYSVAVIDTGIDYTHTALGGGFGPGYKVIAGYDFANNDADPRDDNGHGTVVAGEIAASDPTYSGVAPDASLVALKVLDASGSGTFGNVLNALDWVVANRSRYNIVAVNLSLGAGNYTTNPYTFLDGDFSNLVNNGVFISVAAGNSFYEYGSQVGLDFPAINPFVVSVGAVYDGNFGSMAWANGARDYTTAPDRIASFSQRGPSLSLMAPGALVTSTYLNNTFRSMAGTSMAAPVIAGAAVLIHQALDTQHKAADQSTILGIMQKTGVTVWDGDDENDNVINTGLSFKRLDLAAAINSLGNPAQAPTLQPIANQTVNAGSTLIVTLAGTDPAGLALTYSASVADSVAARAYQLDQQLGLSYYGTYFTNGWGQNEKWITSASNAWYCIIPNGELRRWTGSITTTMQAANLVATLDAGYYADPSLLWNSKPAAAVAVSVQGNQLTIQAPATATGSFQISVTASNGGLSASQSFSVSIGSPVQLAPIAKQTMNSGGSLSLTLTATGSNLTYSARVADSVAARAYQLDQQLDLRYAGSYYTNGWGQNEKWMQSASNWYCILPTGELRRWTGSVATTMQAASLVATLDASYYANPSLLWNASPAATVAVSVQGNQLTIQAPANVTGSFDITVTASNGSVAVSQIFTVTVNAAVQLAPIANQTMSAGSTLTLPLSGTGSNLTYSAAVTDSLAARAYQLDQQLGLNYAGSYYTNGWGQNEKWLQSAGNWYCILPTGAVHRWTGSIATTMQAANLVATLDASYYAAPSLLWNAKPAVPLAVSVQGNQLAIQAPADAAGAFQIQVTASDGTYSATQTFALTVS